MDQWLDRLLHSNYGAAAPGPELLLLIMLLAFMQGQFIGWVYMYTTDGLSYSRSFVASLVFITVLVAMVIVLMASSILIAFGFLAVFAVVRFRNAVKDTRDSAFLMWAVGQGMGTGIQQFSTAMLGGLCIGAVLAYLQLTEFGARTHYDVVLTLQVADGNWVLARVNEILRRHSARMQVANQRKQSNEWLDLSYRLMLRDPSRSRELLAELEQTEGVAEASLYHREDESEI